MATLKDLRTRITSVESTRKITQAMKMVATSKLRRAQEGAEAVRPYAEGMEGMVRSLANTVPTGNAPPLLSGTGSSKVHLLLAITADKGLCGAFNSSVVRKVRVRTETLVSEGCQVKIFCIGRKGADMLRRTHGETFVACHTQPPGREIPFEVTEAFATEIITMFDKGEFDVCTLLYNRFRNVLSQEMTERQIIPRTATEEEEHEDVFAHYEFEPEEEELLAGLLPRNLAIQLHSALLESTASEHGARMTAMDNATRNAGDMIGELRLSYNRQRQAAITKELIEIISGSEAL